MHPKHLAPLAALPAILALPALAHAAPVGIGARSVDPSSCTGMVTFKVDPDVDVWNESPSGTVLGMVHADNVQAGQTVAVPVSRPYTGLVRVHARAFDPVTGKLVTEQWGGFVQVACAAPAPVPPVTPATPPASTPPIVAPPESTPPVTPPKRCVPKRLTVKRRGHVLTASGKVTWIVDGVTRDGSSRRLVVPRSAHVVLARLDTCARFKFRQIVFDKHINGLG